MADLASQVQGFAGILQVDGYGSYKGLARRHPQIQLAFCLAHARRTFVAVYKATHAPLARDVIASLGEVYAIEARIRGSSAAERRAVRQAETKPIMDALKARYGEPVYRAVAERQPDPPVAVVIPPRSTGVPGPAAGSTPSQRD